MRVRPATVDDAGRVAEVHVLSWQVGYRGLLPQPLLDGLHPTQRVPRWAATLEQAAWPRRGTLVADDAGDVVGFADLRPTRDDDEDPVEVGEITSFYVLPTVWGRGVGRQLMDGAVRARCGRVRVGDVVDAGDQRPRDAVLRRAGLGAGRRRQGRHLWWGPDP